jgi:hypothetical protein
MLTDFNNVKKENILPIIEAVRQVKEMSEPERELA